MAKQRVPLELEETVQEILVEVREADGGWYGGGGNGYGEVPGGGGSSYVLTSSSHKPSGYALGSQYYLSNANIIAGDQPFPAPGGGTEVGHSGNGYARITLVE